MPWTRWMWSTTASISGGIIRHWWPPWRATHQGGRRGRREEPCLRTIDVGAARILERQGRTQEYIHLAEQKAVESLRQHAGPAAARLRRRSPRPGNDMVAGSDSVVRHVLRDRPPRRRGGRCATHWLDRREQTELARWTLALAQAADDPALALRAAQTRLSGSFGPGRLQGCRAPRRERVAGIKAALLEQMEIPVPITRLISTSTSTCWPKRWQKLITCSTAAIWIVSIQATRTDFPDWGIGKCNCIERRRGVVIRFGRRLGAHTARDIYRQHDREAEWADVSEWSPPTHSTASLSWCRCCGRYGRLLFAQQIIGRILVVLDPRISA